MAATPKLIVLSEQLRGQAFELTLETYTIGRSEKATICIPDPTISGLHCQVSRQSDGSYMLSDSNSTNGTRVNGIRIQSQSLSNSDIIQIGGVELLYECPEKASTTVMSTQTGIILEQHTGPVAVSDMSNFSPFGSRSGLSQPTNKWYKILFKVFIGVLILAVAILLVSLITKFVQ